MVNITKQDTTNISEIIDKSLDVLNDISITIEWMTPLQSDNFSENYLYIEEEEFDKVFAHKKYLIQKYIRESSFSKRIESLESAQQRLKLLMKSLPSNKQNLSTSIQLTKKPSMADSEPETKNKSFIGKKSEKQIEFEKLCKVRENELKEKVEELKGKEANIKDLQKENEKNKSEIVELNNLVSTSSLLIPTGVKTCSRAVSTSAYSVISVSFPKTKSWKDGQCWKSIIPHWSFGEDEERYDQRSKGSQ